MYQPINENRRLRDCNDGDIILLGSYGVTRYKVGRIPGKILCYNNSHHAADSTRIWGENCQQWVYVLFTQKKFL